MNNTTDAINNFPPSTKGFFLFISFIFSSQGETRTHNDATLLLLASKWLWTVVSLGCDSRFHITHYLTNLGGLMSGFPHLFLLCINLLAKQCQPGHSVNGGEWWIRTTEVVRQQIYSLSHLATLVTPPLRMRSPLCQSLLVVATTVQPLYILSQGNNTFVVRTRFELVCISWEDFLYRTLPL